MRSHIPMHVLGAEGSLSWAPYQSSLLMRTSTLRSPGNQGVHSPPRPCRAAAVTTSRLMASWHHRRQCAVPPTALYSVTLQAHTLPTHRFGTTKPWNHCVAEPVHAASCVDQL